MLKLPIEISNQTSFISDFISGRKTRLALLAIPLSLSLFGLTTPVFALDADDVGVYGSVTITRSAQTAAKSMKKGDWGGAQAEYKKLIGMSPNQEDFYFGLYECSHKMLQWNECATALQQLFDLKPAYKDQMCLEYGECMYYMNRYDEAEPYLKKALATISQPSIVEQKLRRLMDKSIIDYTPQVGKIIEYVAPKEFVRPEREGKLDVSQVSEDTSEKALTYLNAFMKSESVVVAEYKGYDKSDLISYYNPPKANFKIVEYLKGPPLNKSLPVRYEFTRKLHSEEKPKDWKFGSDMMPKPGSKWIIFIPNAVPNDGMFDTFHGSYGRQEYNEQNIDEISKIIEQHKGQTK